MNQPVHHHVVGRGLPLALCGLLLVVYGYFLPRWADPNQNSRLDMVIAVVEDHTFRIDPYVANTVDYAKVGEHYYSDKAPGAALLAVPIYAGLTTALDSPYVAQITARLEQSDAFRATLRAEGSGIFAAKVRFALAQVVLAFALAAIPTALLCVLLFTLLAQWEISLGVRMTVVLGYGLLTPAFAYANAFYGHQLSALLLFGAFTLVATSSVRPLTRTRLLGVGLLLGYSVVTEYPTLLMVAVLFGYTAVTLARQGRWRQIGWVVLSGGVVAAGWMVYNTALFGGPLNLGYGYSELWQEQHTSGFMSLTALQWDAFWGVTFSRFRGLFVLSPWLLLSIPGAILWWRSGRARAEWVVTLACVVSMLLFNASSVMWWGGFAVGPRYLLPILPLLALCSAYAFEDWQTRRWFRWAVVVLMLWSWVAVWGLTLAGQAFPSDTIRHPLADYAWPHWQRGDIARNLGTLMGFSGGWSLLPLGALGSLAMLLGWRVLRRESRLATAAPMQMQTEVHPAVPSGRSS